MREGRINQVRAGAIISYITIFFNIIAGFLYTPWLLRQLGDSDYALYTLVNSVMTYFVLDFGMGAAITRFVAKYRAEGEEEKVKNLLGLSAKIYLLLDVIVFIALLVVYFLLDNIYVNLTQVEIERFKILFLLAGVASVCSFPFLPVNGVYTAYEKLYAQKLFDLIAKILTVVSIVVALFLGGNIYLVVLFNVGITFLTHLFKFGFIKRAERLEINLKYKDTQMLKSLLGFSVWVMLAAIADRFFFTFMPSLLGIVSNSTQITLFSIAVSIENYICLFGGAFNSLFLPRVTKMVIDKESPEKITDLMIKVGRIQLIIVSTFVVALVAMGDEFIKCWVGAGREDSYIVMVLIIVPTLIHFTQGIASEMIYATNNVKYRAMVYALGSVISIVLTVILGPRFGAIGAGIGICAGLVISHIILMNIVYKFKLKLNIGRYFKQCQLRMLIPLIISGIIAYVVKLIYPTDNLIVFLLKGVCWGALHLVLVWLLIMNKEEKQMFKSVIGKIKFKKNRTNNNS